MTNHNAFKLPVADLRELVHLRRFGRKVQGIIILGTIVGGIPYVVVSWMVGAYMCGGGGGPDTSYCM